MDKILFFIEEGVLMVPPERTPNLIPEAVRRCLHPLALSWFFWGWQPEAFLPAEMSAQVNSFQLIFA